MQLTSLQVGFFLSLRQVRRASKWTTGLIIFVMTLTFMNLVVVSGILVGLLTGSFEQFRQYYSGDVIITPAAKRDYIQGSQELIQTIKGDPSVEAVSARYIYGATIRGDITENAPSKKKANESGVSMAGINPEDEERVTNFSRLVIAGEPLKSGDEGYILAGSTLLKEYSSFADANIPGLELLANVNVGSKVRVTITSKAEGRDVKVSKDFIVKGIVKSKVDQVSQRFFMLDTELRKMAGENELNVQEIAIKMPETAAPALIEAVKNTTDPSWVRVQSSSEAIPSFLRDIEATFGIIGNVIGAISLVVATIVIFIVIFINAVTRRKYIGILKGIGVSAAAIQWAYVMQAMFYAFCGVGIATVLAHLVLQPLIAVHPIDFPFSDGVLAVTWVGTGVRAAILFTVTILAGFIPSRMIVKQNTLDAILGR